MECGNLAIFLVFIFMEKQMLSNSWLGSQDPWLYSQFPETLGRSPPTLTCFFIWRRFLPVWTVYCSIKQTKQTRVLWFLFTRGSGSL